MILVGVTGPIASGKTAVCNIFCGMGALLIDADRMGHEALEEPSIKVKLLEYFGDDVIDGAGRINRERIAEIVFSNDEALEFLESLTHPLLIERVEKKISELKSSGFPGIVVIDAAMLPKWDRILKSLDYLVLVQSPRWQRANRLIQDRHYPPEQSENRMNAQDELFDKITPVIDYIIKNNGDLSELRAKTVKVWLDIKSAQERK